MRADLRGERVGGYAPPAAGNFRAAFPVIGKRRAGKRPALIMRLESAGSGSRGAEHARKAIPSRLLSTVTRNVRVPSAGKFSIRSQHSDPRLQRVYLVGRDSRVM